VRFIVVVAVRNAGAWVSSAVASVRRQVMEEG
jgi:hypothetical protein